MSHPIINCSRIIIPYFPSFVSQILQKNIITTNHLSPLKTLLLQLDSYLIISYIIYSKRYTQYKRRASQLVQSSHSPKYAYFLTFPIISPPTQTVLFCYYRMYRTLTYPKLLRRLPHRGIVLNNIIGNVHRTLFDIIFQKETPQNTFLHCMKWSEGL